ncbi:cytochrome c biogenesis protein [Azospirillum sp.]|uniref:cytochrome c biogenesis protein n=1 Tax=Azospirillum sp. TaxID=34012 RepID=UPI003D74C2BE
MLEDWTLLGAIALYALAAVLAAIEARRGRVLPVPALVGMALVVHAVSIALRWQRLGHGPYVDMFEALSSNVWSLHAVALAGVLLIPRLRGLLAAVLPVLQVLVVWLLTVEAQDTLFPVTYDTPWLPVHVLLGKVFLGVTVVAVGGSVVILLRRWTGSGFAALPSTKLLDEINFRLVLLAFVFECLMLAAGAVWAQDAWGRYWNWDPLETWAFLTWLAVAGYLHLRVTRKPPPEVSALAILAIFVVAFGTFFGMPFVSVAPHKGMI